MPVPNKAVLVRLDQLGPVNSNTVLPKVKAGKATISYPKPNPVGSLLRVNLGLSECHHHQSGNKSVKLSRLNELGFEYGLIPLLHH